MISFQSQLPFSSSIFIYIFKLTTKWGLSIFLLEMRHLFWRAPTTRNDCLANRRLLGWCKISWGIFLKIVFVSRTRLVLFFDVCNNDSQIIFHQKVIFLRFIFLCRKPHRGILYGVMLLNIQEMFSFFQFFCRIDPFGSEGNSKGDNCPTKRIFLAFLLCDFSVLMSNFPTYVLCSPVCPINIFISDLN